MKKAIIRVTKWLGDIPVEAQCSVCPTVSFQAQGCRAAEPLIPKMLRIPYGADNPEVPVSV